VLSRRHHDQLVGATGIEGRNVEGGSRFKTRGTIYVITVALASNAIPVTAIAARRPLDLSSSFIVLLFVAGVRISNSAASSIHSSTVGHAAHSEISPPP